jgi:hypothetical protein
MKGVEKWRGEVKKVLQIIGVRGNSRQELKSVLSQTQVGNVNRRMDQQIYQTMKAHSAFFRYCVILSGGLYQVRRAWLALLFCTTISLLSVGCHTPAETAGLIAGSIVTGAVSPANEIEQVYYLGNFDPEEQLPPQVYRVRVHGQSSIISGVRFASGWAPASLIDSLGGQVSLNPNGASGPDITAPSAGQAANLDVGRRMWLFGPEGFRVAPANQRLVIVMSGDPSKFFNAIDQTLGNTAAATPTDTTSTMNGNLLAAYQDILTSRDLLQKIQMQQQSIQP